MASFESTSLKEYKFYIQHMKSLLFYYPMVITDIKIVGRPTEKKE